MTSRRLGVARVFGLLLGVSAACLWLAPAALARWTGPTRLSARSSQGDIADYPVVATFGHHHALAAWQQSVGSSAYWIDVRAWHNRRWGSVARISPSGQGAISPALELGRRGGGVLVWQAISGPSGRVYPAAVAISRRSGSARWSTPQAISPVHASASTPSVALDGHRHAIAVWAGSANGHWLVQVSTCDVTTGRWAAPRTLARSAHRLLLAPRVAVNHAERAVIAWFKVTSGSIYKGGLRGQTMASVQQRASGRWSRPRDLGAFRLTKLQGIGTPYQPAPAVAVDRSGQVIVVWQGHVDRAKASTTIRSRIYSGSRWQHEETVTDAGAWPAIAETPAGQVTVAWAITSPHLITRIRTATTTLDSPASRWSEPSTLTTTKAALFHPSITINTSGRALLSWSVGGNGIRTSFRHGVTGNWTSPTRLGRGNAGGLSVGSLAKDTALGLWVQPGKTNGRADNYINAARFSTR